MCNFKHLPKIFFVINCLVNEIVGEDNRIVGGYKAEDGQFPYQVSLQLRKHHNCGGSILNEKWILTAAHCVNDQTSNYLSVVVGTNELDKEGERYEVEEIIVNPDYSTKQSIKHDIALLKVKDHIVFNDHVKPVKLPAEDVQDNEKVILSGWGRVAAGGKVPNSLQAIDLKTISNSECKEAYKEEEEIFDSNICTLTMKGEGACNGDSGGPLVYKEEQVGVVSWGMPCAVGYPDVFTRVHSYLEWINNNIG